MFKRDLAPEQRERMDETFWLCYENLIEEMQRVRNERGGDYNYNCSVVDHFQSPDDILAILRMKCLRVEQGCRRWLDREDVPRAVALLAREVPDIANMALYLYCWIASEESK